MCSRRETLKKKNFINDLYKNISNYLTTGKDSGKIRVSIISPPAVLVTGSALQPNAINRAFPEVCLPLASLGSPPANYDY